MHNGKFLALLAGIISLVGTYVIAIYGIAGDYAGSGIGFIMNISTLFLNASTYAEMLTIEVWLFYFILVVFIIFLIAGLLQIIFMKSRIFSILWSLFPFGVGLMFIFLGYTIYLGNISEFFGGLFFSGEHYGNLFPFIVNVGGDLGLGAYFILGGGILGLISGFLQR
jgi:hypothetical protein